MGCFTIAHVPWTRCVHNPTPSFTKRKTFISTIMCGVPQFHTWRIPGGSVSVVSAQARPLESTSDIERTQGLASVYKNRDVMNAPSLCCAMLLHTMNPARTHVKHALWNNIPFNCKKLNQTTCVSVQHWNLRPVFSACQLSMQISLVRIGTAGLPN